MSTMLNRTPLPTRYQLHTKLTQLLDDEVAIGDGIAAPARSTNLVGVYVTEKLATAALVITDLEAAARLGGSLAALPRPAVQEAIAARALTPVLSRHFYTLLSNLAELFQVEGGARIELYEMYEATSVVPADVAALAGQAGQRMDLRLGISGYGVGQLAVIVR